MRNSGNSTEPHVHVQVTDSTDWQRARGVPLAFRGRDGTVWVPGESLLEMDKGVPGENPADLPVVDPEVGE